MTGDCTGARLWKGSRVLADYFVVQCRSLDGDWLWSDLIVRTSAANCIGGCVREYVSGSTIWVTTPTQTTSGDVSGIGNIAVEYSLGGNRTGNTVANGDLTDPISGSVYGLEFSGSSLYIGGSNALAKVSASTQAEEDYLALPAFVDGGTTYPAATPDGLLATTEGLYYSGTSLNTNATALGILDLSDLSDASGAIADPSPSNRLAFGGSNDINSQPRRTLGVGSTKLFFLRGNNGTTGSVIECTRSTGASDTDTGVDGRSVYVVSDTAIVVCDGANGVSLYEDSGGWSATWTNNDRAAEDATVHGGYVYVVGGSYVRKLDITDGSEEWEARTVDGWSIAVVNSDRVVVSGLATSTTYDQLPPS